VTRHRYVVDGWGVGEVWADEGVLVAHELTFSAKRRRGGARVPTPPGDAPLASMRRRAPVTGLAVGRKPLPPKGGARPPTGTLAAEGAQESDGLVPALCRRFAEHLGGGPAAYDDVVVDDGWCTPFQAELLRALRAIPWGEVVSYGELAALAGRPGAARAAGSFCAHNRFALVVPCHRVVAAEGIGGYGSSGVRVKRRLLALEGVRM
jgi:methylated-DNA-[protein]-cysteine S-methyltransferase